MPGMPAGDCAGSRTGMTHRAWQSKRWCTGVRQACWHAHIAHAVGPQHILAHPSTS